MSGYQKQYSQPRRGTGNVEECASCRMKLGVNSKCAACILHRDPEASAKGAKTERQLPRHFQRTTRVFVRSLGCTGTVAKALFNSDSKLLNGYRVNYDVVDAVFEQDAVGEHPFNEVFRLIQSSDGWPEGALDLHSFVKGTYFFNEYKKHVSGTGRICAACVDIDDELHYFAVLLEGHGIIFFVHKVNVSPVQAPEPSSTTTASPLVTTANDSAVAILKSNRAPASSAKTQTFAAATRQAATPAKTQPSAAATPAKTQPSATPANIPSIAATPAKTASSDTATLPPSSANIPSTGPATLPLPESAPVATINQQATQSNGQASATPAQSVVADRLRKCKDCGSMFPFVARITLCPECGVQRRTASAGNEGRESDSGSSSDNDEAPGPGGKRRRAPKFTPEQSEFATILYVIAVDCPYTHQRDSQKQAWDKCLKELHKEGQAKQCTHHRQLKAWCNKICEIHHNAVLAQQTKSGVGEEIPKATILDTVSADWAEYQLRSGKASKLNKKQAEIIRQMCTQSAVPLPDFAAAIASGREKHNAVHRTTLANSRSPTLEGHGAAAGTPAATPQRPSTPVNVNRDTLRQVMTSLMTPPALHSDAVRQPTFDSEAVAKFKEELVALERAVHESGPHASRAFVSRLDAHIPLIMAKLGVECVPDLDELNEGQENACDIPVLAMNRLKAILAARRQ
jgi:hypothetical protein